MIDFAGGRPYALVALLLLGSFAPDAARAAVYSVGARTEAQAYQLRSWAGRRPDDAREISRYQITQYLELGAYGLSQSRKWGRVDFVSSLRLLNDFGDTEAELEALIDEWDDPDVELLFAYLAWTGAFDGLLDVELGRQIELDMLEFFAFDGLEVRVHTPAHLGVSLFGGWQVKGTSLLGSPTFSPDGVRISDRRRIAGGASTELLGLPAADLAYDYLDAPSPIFGARLRLEGVRGIEASAVYRRAISETSGEDLELLPEEARGWQVDLEHFGVGGRVALLDGRLFVYGSADRDLYRDRWAALRAGAKGELIPYRLSATLEAQSYNPSFDADSIWNLFATGPRDEYELRLDADLGPVSVYAGPLLTAFHLDLTERVADKVGAAPDGISMLPGGVAGISLDPMLPWRAGADALFRKSLASFGELDYLGDELWLSAAVGRNFRDRYALDLRLSWAQVSDPNNEALQDLSSFGAAVIGRAELSEEAAVTAIVEHNTNDFVSSDLRGYAILELRTNFR